MKPLWDRNSVVTAKRLQRLIKGIVNGYATPNPADWSLLSMPVHGLVAKKVKTQNYPAMDVPKFWNRLDMSDVRHRCIGILILTAARRE
jgi:hypothetical protein